MADQHPITPSIELMSQWTGDWNPNDESLIELVARQAAQWGANQELDACCEWIANNSLHHAESDLLNDLRAARRPQPKSLAEKSLDLIDKIQSNKKMWQIEELDVVRRALERLQELEGQDDG